MECNSISHTLPKEIWFHTLNFFTPPELNVVANTNRFFYALVNDDNFYASYAKFYGESFSIKTGIKKAFKVRLIENTPRFERMANNVLAIALVKKNNPNITLQIDFKGNTLLNILAQKFSDCEDFGKKALTLKPEGAGFFKPNFEGNSPFFNLLHYGFDSPPSKYHLHDLIDIILKRRDIDLTIKNKFGQTIFHKLCEEICYDKLELIKYIILKLRELKVEIDLNVKDNFGLTPLHYALLNKSTEIAKFLLTNGASISSESINFNGFIENLQARNPHSNILKILEPKGNSFDFHLLEADLDEEDKALIKLSSNLQRPRDVKQLMIEIQRYINYGKHSVLKTIFPEIVRRIPNRWIELHFKNGLSFAHLAALLNDGESIKLIAKKGGNLTLIYTGYSPLHLAILHSCPKAFFALLEHGAPLVSPEHKSLAYLLIECISYEIIDYCLTNKKLYINLEEQISVKKCVLVNDDGEIVYDSKILNYSDEKQLAFAKSHTKIPYKFFESDLDLLMLIAKDVNNTVLPIALMQRGVRYTLNYEV